MIRMGFDLVVRLTHQHIMKEVQWCGNWAWSTEECVWHRTLPNGTLEPIVRDSVEAKSS